MNRFTNTNPEPRDPEREQDRAERIGEQEREIAEDRKAVGIMTTPEQIIALAEWEGKYPLFVIMKHGLYYRPNAHGYTNDAADAWLVTKQVASEHEYLHDEPVTIHPAPLPRYPEDLNAIEPVFKELASEGWSVAMGMGENGVWGVTLYHVGLSPVLVTGPNLAAVMTECACRALLPERWKE
jgi:hypothetical protein